MTTSTLMKKLIALAALALATFEGARDLLLTEADRVVVNRHPGRRDFEQIELTDKEWRKVLGQAKGSGLALFALAASLALLTPSCSNDYFSANLGHYKAVPATDPDARFGAFIEQPTPATESEVTPDKP